MIRVHLGFEKLDIQSDTLRHSDGAHVRVIAAESPGPGAVPVAPTLENAYLHLLSGEHAQ